MPAFRPRRSCPTPPARRPLLFAAVSVGVILAFRSLISSASPALAVPSARNSPLFTAGSKPIPSVGRSAVLSPPLSHVSSAFTSASASSSPLKTGTSGLGGVTARSSVLPPLSHLSSALKSDVVKCRGSAESAESARDASGTAILPYHHPRLNLRSKNKFSRDVKYGPNGCRRLVTGRATWENKFVYTDWDNTRAKDGRRIVICVDASEHSASCLDWCKTKLLHREDEVHLLHVYEFQPLAPLPGPLDTYSAMESVAEQNRKLEIAGEQNAVTMMKHYQDNIANGGFLNKRPSVSVLRGACTQEICDYAEQHNADLLVLASRGLGAVKRFLLGSVSGYCVHNCKVPVLVVKEDQHGRRGVDAITAAAAQTRSRVVQDIE